MLKKARAEGLPWLPAPIAVGIAIEMCRGLHYAHTRLGEDGEPLGLVHRDISPDNVLLSYDGEVKVSDFGIAKARLAGRAETDAGVVKGKYLYFSPEQAKGEPLDARSDVYAVGVVLYQMLCGRRPVEGGELEVMRGIAEGRLTPAQKLNPAMDALLREILRQALATSREERYPTAEALQVALSEWAGARAPSFSSHTRKHLLGWLFREQLAAQRRAPSLPPDFPRLVERWRGDVAPPSDSRPWEVAAIEMAAPPPVAPVRVTPWPAQQSLQAHPPDTVPEPSPPPRRKAAFRSILPMAALGSVSLGILTMLLTWGVLRFKERASGHSLPLWTGGQATAPVRAVLHESRHSFNPSGPGEWIVLNPKGFYSVSTEGEYRPALPMSVASQDDEAVASGDLLLFAEGKRLSPEQRLWMASGVARPLAGVNRLKAFVLRSQDWPGRDYGSISLQLRGVNLTAQLTVPVHMETASIEVEPASFFTVTRLSPALRYTVEIQPRGAGAGGNVVMVISTARSLSVEGPDGASPERLQVLRPGRYTVAGAQELRFTLPRLADDPDIELEVEVREEGT
jgi:hypothetical protein